MTGYETQSATFDTEAEAIEWRNATINALKSGKSITKTDESERITLSMALERYRLEVTPTKAGHKAENNRIIALQKLPLAQWKLAEIGSMQIAQLRNDYKAQNKKPSTIKNNIRPISNVFQTAKSEWGMYSLVNPCRGVKMPTDNPHRDRRINAEELELLSGYLISPYKEAFLFILETALRRGECCELLRTDIDFKKRVMRIRKTKNKKGKIVPLSSEAVRILKSLPGQIDRPIFGIGNPDTFTHHITAACKELGIEDLHLHDGRHEAVSRWVESGLFRDSEIMSMSGHTTLKSFMVYVQINAENLAKRLK